MNGAVNQYRPGMTAPSGELVHLLGQPGRFPDLDYSVEARTPLSSRWISAIWVKNNSGTTLAPALGAIFGTDADDYGRYVEGLSSVGERVAGIVDPFLPSAVANGRHFWLFVGGPCDVQSDGNGVIAINDRIVGIGSATGLMREQVAAASMSTVENAVNAWESFVGHAIEGAVAVSGTRFRCDLMLGYNL